MTKEQLNKILIAARNSKKLSHKQVAKLVTKKLASIKKKGITRQYYGMIENVERRPSVDVAKAIANTLGISWTIFFEVDSNKTLLKHTSKEVS